MFESPANSNITNEFQAWFGFSDGTTSVTPSGVTNLDQFFLRYGYDVNSGDFQIWKKLQAVTTTVDTSITMIQGVACTVDFQITGLDIDVYIDGVFAGSHTMLAGQYYLKSVISLHAGAARNLYAYHVSQGISYA